MGVFLSRVYVSNGQRHIWEGHSTLFTEGYFDIHSKQQNASDGPGLRRKPVAFNSIKISSYSIMPTRELTDRRRVSTNEAARITAQPNAPRSSPRSQSRPRNENSRASAHAFMLAAQGAMRATQGAQERMRATQAAQASAQAARASAQGAMRVAQERMRATHAVQASAQAAIRAARAEAPARLASVQAEILAGQAGETAQATLLAALERIRARQAATPATAARLRAAHASGRAAHNRIHAGKAATRSKSGPHSCKGCRKSRRRL